MIITHIQNIVPIDSNASGKFHFSINFSNQFSLEVNF